MIHKQQTMVEVPIKCCHRCWCSYTLGEWRSLPELDTTGDLEIRRCGCGQELAADPEGLEDLVHWVPAEEYAAHFPNSMRPSMAHTDRGRALDDAVRFYFVAGVVLALILIALLGSVLWAVVVSGS